MKAAFTDIANGSRSRGRSVRRRAFKLRGITVLVVTAGLLAGLTWPSGVAAKPSPKRAKQQQPAPEPAAEVKVVGAGLAPAIKCDNPVRDFGEHWMGPILKHSFVIKNEGKGPLEIKRIKPACGCTIAGKYPTTIAPGESGEFPFSLDSNKLRGKYQKGIMLHTNDPATPALSLKLTGICNRYVDVLPSHANFGRVTGGGPQTRVLKITNNTEGPLALDVNPKEEGGFKFELVEQKAGKEYELRVSMIEPVTPGNKRAYTALKTNIKQQKSIRVGAAATVPERLDVRPRTFMMAESRKQAYSRAIDLNNYGSTPVKLLEASCTESALKLGITEESEGKKYKVRVDVPAGYKPPAENGMITLKTTDAEKPIIEIPIKVQVDTRKAQAKPAKPPVRKRPVEELIGKAAPAFSFETLDGKKMSNAELAKGPATILNFVAPNCGYCKKQVPRIDTLRKDYEAKGVRFINVVQTMRKKFTTEEVVGTFKTKLASGMELAHDPDNAVGGPFKARGFPTMVVLGKSGKVEAVNIGNLGDLEGRLKGQLDALVAGKPVPRPEATAKAPPTEKPKRTRPVEELVGKAAPAFSFETLDGKKMSNTELAKGPATILNFVASNCGYCKKQVPRLDTLRKDYEAKGVRFINVVETMRKKFTTEEVVDIFQTKLQVGIEITHDPDNIVGAAFKARSFPTMVVLGKSGKVEAANIGNIGDLETKVKGQLDALIAGKPVPKPAATAKAQPKRKRPAEQLVGKAAPAFSFETLDGKKMSSADLAKGPATVLNFVAPNCGFCKRQIPRIDKLRSDYEAKGIRFINVVQTMRKKFKTEEVVDVFKTKVGSGMELAHDPDNKVGGVFKATSFPTMVVLGKSGKVEAVNVGNLGDLENRMSKQLDALVAGKPVPQFASAQSKPRKRPAEEMLGKPAPQFSIETVAGKAVSSADFAKHPATVLNFVAPNCGFCKRQVPNIESIREEYEKKGVRFVNVAMTMRKPYSVEEVVEVFKGVGSQLELAHDPENKVGGMFKATSFPTMMVVGKDGTVKHVNIGAKQDLDKLLKGQLDALIK